MSNHQMLQNCRIVSRNTALHFLLMLLGVVVLPVIVFVNGGADTSPQNTANLFWQFAALGGLLCAALLLGWALFKRKASSLSIATPPAAQSVADGGVI
jgi:hypothetical protein